MRSPKVQNLLNEMPKSLTVIGFIAIVLILTAILFAVTLIPYPYSQGESLLKHMTGSFHSIS